MGIELEKHLSLFKDHVATLNDYGPLKVLDFGKPGDGTYRVRFIFEEDRYRLHITGDLGDLIACNYKNMTFDGFWDFVDNTGYFNEKISCHNRPIFLYSREKAENEIREHIKENELLHLIRGYSWEDTDEEVLESFIENVMEHFSAEAGFDAKGYEVLEELYDEPWEIIPDMGKESSGILDLYMLAFKLATEQLGITKEKEN